MRWCAVSGECGTTNDERRSGPNFELGSGFRDQLVESAQWTTAGVGCTDEY